MPRIEHIIRVFVGSPSDVSQERECLETVILELNRIWSNLFQLRLELVRWETHVYPGFGTDPQAVINEQIGDEYDVFIGIFWARLGTPTERAASGSVEELERAHDKYKKDPESIDILVYFKDTPIPPSEIDVSQIGKIQDLKQSLDEAGLYFQFKNQSDFESLLRSHLSRLIQKWKDRLGEGMRTQDETSAEEVLEEKGNSPTIDLDNDEDLGFLDYIDIHSDRMGVATSVITAMSKDLEKYNQNITKRTAELRSLGKIEGSQTIGKAKRILKRTADDMKRLSETTNRRVSELSTANSEAFSALSQALALYSDFNTEDKESLQDLLSSVERYLSPVNESCEQLKALRQSVANQARVTAEFNRGKRQLLNSLDLLSGELERIGQSAKNIIGTLEAMVNEGTS